MYSVQLTCASENKAEVCGINCIPKLVSFGDFS